MRRLIQLVVAAVATIPVAAGAQALTEAQARAAIAPWYALFNLPVQGDMRTLQEQVLTADYESCWGYLPGECWRREASIKVVGGFARSIPDMKFDNKEVLVSGDRVIVRGEVTGTPAGELFGVPHTGKSFRIMAIDIQTIREGKIARTYHVENCSARWGSSAPSSELRRAGGRGWRDQQPPTPPRPDQARSKRSRSITFAQALTKSWTNCAWASALP